MRVQLEADTQVDEDFLELVLNDLWDMVKRVRRTRGKRKEQYTLWFGPTQVEITVERKAPVP